MIENKISPTNAAKRFIERHFTGCDLAILSGSTVRNSATLTSDLDIVVVDRKLSNCYRESFVEFGWPIEVFVHNNETIRSWIDKDILRRKPSMPTMIVEGLLIEGSESYFLDLKHYSKSRLNNGPAQFTKEEDLSERYFLTDLVDDFIGSTNYIDDVFILNQILEKLVNFKMVKSGQWLVHGKRIQRALIALDSQYADTLFTTMKEFYRTGNKHQVIQMVESTLSQFGGRVFEGYAAGKT